MLPYYPTKNKINILDVNSDKNQSEISNIDEKKDNKKSLSINTKLFYFESDFEKLEST